MPRRRVGVLTGETLISTLNIISTGGILDGVQLVRGWCTCGGVHAAVLSPCGIPDVDLLPVVFDFARYLRVKGEKGG